MNMKIIDECPSYAVTDDGQVWSFYTNKFLKQKIDKYGYACVSLSKDGKSLSRTVHRLVAKAFIPNPENKPTVNHKDENKLNNCVNNLEWIRHIDNINFGTRTERAGYSLSKPILQYSKSGEFIREWPGAHEVERMFGIANSHINDCCRGKRKSAGGFIWRYKEKD